MVELAVILPVLATLVFAMLEATRMCMVAQLLTNAARDGCRVAATNGKKWTDATARITATLTPSNLNNLVTIPTPNTLPENTHLGDMITVTVTVPFSSVNWLPTPFFYSGTRKVIGTATMSSERP
jgi:Flp pilus assembly protein TadG